MKDNMVRAKAELRMAASCADISDIKQANMAKKNAVNNVLMIAKDPATTLKLHKSDRK